MGLAEPDDTGIVDHLSHYDDIVFILHDLQIRIHHHGGQARYRGAEDEAAP